MAEHKLWSFDYSISTHFIKINVYNILIPAPGNLPLCTLCISSLRHAVWHDTTRRNTLHEQIRYLGQSKYVNENKIID